MSDGAKSNGNGRLWLRIPISRETILIVTTVIGIGIATTATISRWFQAVQDQMTTETRERKESDERLERDANLKLGVITNKVDEVLGGQRKAAERAKQ